jgi:hypothetical protein
MKEWGKSKIIIFINDGYGFMDTVTLEQFGKFAKCLKATNTGAENNDITVLLR